MWSPANNGKLQMKVRFIFVIVFTLLLSSCGFRPAGDMQLAPPLHQMYLQTPDPYGYLARDLRNYLKMSNVVLVSSPQEAQTILAIAKDATSQSLLSVSSTTQTRQYNLQAMVAFMITDAQGRILVPSTLLTESRVITVQSDQILGSSNEANLYYQQMRHSLAYAIMNRIASSEVSLLVSTPAKLTKTKSP